MTTVADRVAFRVNDTLAVGHDALNAIVFAARKKPHAPSPQLDGQSWVARYFVHRDKAALIVFLRELGATSDQLAAGGIASLPPDLREWRAAQGGALRLAKTAVSPLAGVA